MGIFKALGKTLSAAVDVVVLPVDLIKDALTLGGACTGEDCATKERLQSVYKQLKDAAESLDND